MIQRPSPRRRPTTDRFRALPAAFVLCALAAVAAPASAYVVVTADNQVYEVDSRPELRGDLLFFHAQGLAVSLRIYDVNVAKTNELNAMMERGGDAASIASEVRSLRRAELHDDRIIVSSRLHQSDYQRRTAKAPEIRLVRNRDRVSPSFSDSPGPAYGSSSNSDRASQPAASRESSFSREARQALADAEQSVAQERRGGASSPARDARAADRLASLDAEIEAEQAYLRQLSAGEVTVDDLDRAIAKSMDKIRGLQRQREQRGSRAASAGDGRSSAAPDSDDRGHRERAPRAQGGSKTEKLQNEIQEAEARLQRLRSQQAAIPAGAAEEREVTDELIGETEYRLDKLRRKLEAAGGR